MPGAPHVRVATVEDAPAIGAIGRIGFPAVHDAIVGRAFAAAVVEQTYALDALSECITRCDAADDAIFLVAEVDGAVAGYLHFDSEGPEPELHRIYVDASAKRGGIGSALMRELHAWLPAGSTYILLVAEANTDARAFYERHGLVVDRHVDGNTYYTEAMSIDVDSSPIVAAVLMRYRNADA